MIILTAIFTITCSVAALLRWLSYREWQAGCLWSYLLDHLSVLARAFREGGWRKLWVASGQKDENLQ